MAWVNSPEEVVQTLIQSQTTSRPERAVTVRRVHCVINGGALNSAGAEPLHQPVVRHPVRPLNGGAAVGLHLSSGGGVDEAKLGAGISNAERSDAPNDGGDEVGEFHSGGGARGFRVHPGSEDFGGVEHGDFAEAVVAAPHCEVDEGVDVVADGGGDVGHGAGVLVVEWVPEGVDSLEDVVEAGAEEVEIDVVDDRGGEGVVWSEAEAAVGYDLFDDGGHFVICHGMTRTY